MSLRNTGVFFLFLLCTFMVACVGPVYVQETARTVGKGNVELLGGYGNGGYVVKANLGLSDNWDLGLQFESLSYGVRTKYAFLNPRQEGFGLAVASGLGGSIGGYHVYADLLASYLINSFEPYLTVRGTCIYTREFLSFSSELFNISRVAGTIWSGEVFLGSKFWVTKHLSLSPEISLLWVGSSYPVIVYGGGLGFRF